MTYNYSCKCMGPNLHACKVNNCIKKVSVQEEHCRKFSKLEYLALSFPGPRSSYSEGGHSDNGTTIYPMFEALHYTG